MLALLFLFPVLSSALTLPEFQEKMKTHMAALPGKATASVRMELLGKGDVLFDHNGDAVLIPASNSKLITATAALEKLGAGYTFDTQVFRKGDDLVISSNGDPYLVSERLWLLARDVARSGIKKVGSIRVATGAYSEPYKGLTEFEDSGEPFTALVTATALNFNSVEIHVVPEPGKKPRVEAGPLPNAYAVIENQVTETSGSGRNLSVKPRGAAGGKETFVVSGTIGRSAPPATVYGIAGDPEAYVAASFAALLRKEGITVANDFGGTVKEGSGTFVATLESLPLQDLVRLFNTYSNNFMAESVFQAIGAGDGAASSARSRKAVADFLQSHAACKDSSVTNGSGLSWDTRISAHCFTEIIAKAFGEFRVFADLLGSLPAGGETGTLKNRFKHAKGDFEAEKVRGKTGTLWSKQIATSLTGVTAAASGEKVIFSLIENDQRKDPALLHGLKEWEEKCLELVQQLRF
jgi:D-alanyl-D-alanine carboxypeptidase/D-alanyl-D-alanine-endopeptidase (penicillin-binding protein 4)